MRSFVNLPGGPTVIVTCHPVKAANIDNLLPRGGGAFLNEVDGNLVCIKDNMTVKVHWHGKFRGPEFAPLHFVLQPGTTEKLKDSKGRSIFTITAAPLTENEASEKNEITRRNQNRLLAVLKDNNRLSLAELANEVGWYMKDGNPNKSLVYRTLQTLLEEKLVKKVRGNYELTKAGKEAAGAADGGTPFTEPRRSKPSSSFTEPKAQADTEAARKARAAFTEAQTKARETTGEANKKAWAAREAALQACHEVCTLGCGAMGACKAH
jgi:DNA-binding PadR family transcriptional regulator